jgi:hypothetical protein
MENLEQILTQIWAFLEFGQPKSFYPFITVLGDRFLFFLIDTKLKLIFLFERFSHLAGKN